jgi:hypothetical protein
MLYPLFAMTLLIFVIMLITVRTRFAAVKSGAMSGSYFKTMSGAEPPAAVAKTSRQFSNLFETPTLFYAAGVIYLALDLQLPLTVTLAWLYVALRLVHAVIHIGYNNVMHRLMAFAASLLCVGGIWVCLLVEAG